MALHQLNDKAREFVDSVNAGERRREVLTLLPPPREPSGVFDYRVVRCVLFGTVTLAILAVGSVAILAVWELLTAETAWRISLTFVIAVLSLSLFTVANESFADKLGRPVPMPSEASPVVEAGETTPRST
jgi:hypothetical protein